jgi:hypothetical protein
LRASDTLVIALLIWVVVGFFFWVPRLVYSIVHLSALVAYEAVSDSSGEVSARRLERSVRFYLEGFRTTIRAIYRGKSTPAIEVISINVNTLVYHTLTALAFWLVIIAINLWYAGPLKNWLNQVNEVVGGSAIGQSFRNVPDHPE